MDVSLSDSPDIFDSLLMDVDSCEDGPRATSTAVPLHELSLGQINDLDAYR